MSSSSPLGLLKKNSETPKSDSITLPLPLLEHYARIW
jgi:hypothetical protein